MCILCVASRWSRRIVTMLPWLIIPLIILWALSQLLPPGFRFEVTSPRLACVGVLLISLGWYELAMPRLSMWRAKRSALQRERRRIEAQEAAKWRKEATRRCRNCLSAYRDQAPGGGKFMCTFCGHISKRPVLDVPGGQEGMVPGGPMPSGLQPPNGAGSAASFLGPRSSRGWAGRGWPDRGGWVPGGRGWTSSSKGWTPGGGGGGWAGGNGPSGPTNWSGKSWTNTGSANWGGGGSPGGNWGGISYGSGGFFGSEGCVAGDPHQGGLFYALFQSVSLIFSCLRWVWRKLWRRERLGEDGSPSGSRRVGQRKGEDSGILQGSRGDKARRKAEERRQARLEREQLEAEERRQREEVARLVEERRRLRDEKLEAEKESEREAAAERERELRREREAERRRQEKVKEKEKEMAKEKPREADSEDTKKKKEKKDVDKKTTDTDKRGAEAEKKASPSQNGDLKKATKGSRGAGADTGHRAAADTTAVKVGSTSTGKVGSSRYIGLGKGAGSAPPKPGVSHQSSTSFWGKGLTSGKSAKGHTPAGSTPGTAGCSTVDTSSGKSAEASYSTWNRMPWTKVWGKSTTSPSAEGNVAQPTGSPNATRRPETTKQNGAKSAMNGSSESGVADLSQSPGELKQSPAVPSHARSWQRLFSNSNSSAVAPSPLSDMDYHQESQQKVEAVAAASQATENVPVETENTIVFGHGLPKQTVVAPVGPPVHLPPLSFVPMSPPSITSGMTTSAYTPVLGTSTFASPPSVPAPISKPVQLPVHPPVSSPLHMPAPIQMPVPITSQSQSHVPQDQLPQILDPWGQPPVSVDDPAEGTVGDKWQMWDSPQLDQIQLSSITEPLNNWSYLNSSFLEQPKDSLRPLTQQPLEPGSQLPASLFSPHPLVGPGCNSADVLGALPISNSQSLWSDHSAFESAMRIWDDSDSHQRVPPEFVDCITQEVMKDPVITADGHSYERAAIERWLQTHDTSPITGEVLPAPQGGYGSGVDKSLRPNHILRGQIIEYRESMARFVRGSMLENNRENNWSVGLGLGGSAWSTERPQIGGFYSTPGVQSVWSYNGSQNSQNPVLPLI